MKTLLQILNEATDSEKTVYIQNFHKGGNSTIHAGTVEYLRTKVFKQLLELGNAYNKNIKTDPKTVILLVKYLNMSSVASKNFDETYYVSSKKAYDMQNN